MSKEQEETKKRSEQIVELFKAMRGKRVQDFPVPPFTKWLNGTIIEVERGEIEMEFVVRPEMANPTGILHGGMQCAIMDDTIGITCATLGYEGFLIGIDFHADYLGRVEVGEKIRVKGRIVREGRRIVHATAEIHCMDGGLVATGETNLSKTSFRPNYAK
jgi:uncharacterized protein (TIGR00369 family)